MFKLDLEKAEEPEIKLPTFVGSSKKQRIPEEHLLLLYWLCQSLWLCQFSSVDQSCLTLCDTMNRSMPGLPIHHQLPESTHTHVHWVGGANQPSHPLSSPSPPALDLSQHQGLFKWVSSSHQVAKVLELQLQHQSFQSQQTVENSEGNGNTRPPDLPLEKSVCRSGSNS